MQTIETIVHRLFSDAEFRASAIADPESALASYPLSDLERETLITLCRQLIDGPVAAVGIRGVWF